MRSNICGLGTAFCPAEAEAESLFPPVDEEEEATALEEP